MNKILNWLGYMRCKICKNFIKPTIRMGTAEDPYWVCEECYAKIYDLNERK